MRLISIFTSGFALVAACPPPFNNHNFFGVNETAAYIEEHRDNATSGWADVVGDWRNLHRQWPRDKARTETLIQYCYYDPLSKTFLTRIVGNALKMWFDKIGPAGEQSKHSLGVKEYRYSKGVLPYCRIPKSKEDRTPIWNPDVKDDTLVIKMQAGSSTSAEATMGYVYKETNSDEGRHYVAIPFSYSSHPNDQEFINVVAHEFGHVFGMYHEHQRVDRDHYVRYQCDKLEGYDKAMEEVNNRGKHSILQLCTSATIGYEYNFPAAPQYSKEQRKDSIGSWFYVTKGGVYDWQSIMHYTSDAFRNDKLSRDPPNVPLFRWLKGSNDYDPPPMTNPPKAGEAKIIDYSEQKITDDLKSRLQLLYPWEDKPAGIH